MDQWSFIANESFRARQDILLHSRCRINMKYVATHYPIMWPSWWWCSCKVTNIWSVPLEQKWFDALDITPVVMCRRKCDVPINDKQHKCTSVENYAVFVYSTILFNSYASFSSGTFATSLNAHGHAQSIVRVLLRCHKFKCLLKRCLVQLLSFSKDWELSHNDWVHQNPPIMSFSPIFKKPSLLYLESGSSRFFFFSSMHTDIKRERCYHVDSKFKTVV